ncbi:hypothetical protein JHK86_004431 [Glycine max]|nr:hypothetical protein JHK86_004431 [Glycine max]
MVRTLSCDKSGMRKGTWTPEEDMNDVVGNNSTGCMIMVSWPFGIARMPRRLSVLAVTKQAKTSKYSILILTKKIEHHPHLNLILQVQVADSGKWGSMVSLFPGFITKGSDVLKLNVELYEAIAPLDRGVEATLLTNISGKQSNFINITHSDLINL